MLRHDRFAGRRFALISADASLAFVTAFSSTRYPTPECRVLAGVCMALITIAVLKFFGNYLGALRRSLGLHAGPLAVVSVLAGIGLRFALRVRGISTPGVEVWRVAFVLFSGLLALRMVLVHAHRCWLVRKKLWVMAETLLAAHQLAAKAQAFANVYQVERTSCTPSAPDLHLNLPAFDAVLCTSSLRGRMQMACNELGKELLLIPSASDALLYTASACSLNDQVVLSLPQLQLTTAQKSLKRALDIGGACALISVCAPVMAALYWLIPRDSPGPSIFRQARRGLHGRSFEQGELCSNARNPRALITPQSAALYQSSTPQDGRWLEETCSFARQCRIGLKQNFNDPMSQALSSYPIPYAPERCV